MASIGITALFNSFNLWPGNLLRAAEDTVVTARTGTTFGFTLGASSDFTGFKVLVTGTGFSYIDGVPVGGTMSSVKIMNAAGGTVLNVTGLTGTLPRDFDQFYASVFGSRLDGNGPGPNGREAWDLLTLGNDTINGTAGDDRDVVVSYNQGNDTFNLRAGNDSVRGDVGTDTYNGGTGYDRLSFFDSGYQFGSNLVGGIVLNVGARTVRDVWGSTDRFTSIEQFEGSRFDDVFNGTAGTSEDFIGLRGNDTFRGGQATLNGSGGLMGDDGDTVRYSSDYYNGGRFGIVAQLETSVSGGSVRGTIRDGFGNIDTVYDIEIVQGTVFGDRFVGSRAENIFDGGEGRDSYVGNDGSDRISFGGWFGDQPPTGIVVDLRKASGQIVNDGFGNTENARGIEEISGTRAGDRIIMNGADNQIQGEDGKDTLTGGGGEDTFFFIGQNEANDGDRITDFVPGVDNITFDSNGWDNMTTTIRVVNGTAATTNRATAVFNPANDTLYWDPDGTGSRPMLAVVVLTGVNALSTGDVLAY